MNVNVKDNIATVSARERNESRKDAFVDFKTWDADEAFRRLKVVRETIKTFENGIYEAGTRSLPSATLERYEEVKALLRSLEIAECDTIRAGE